MPDLKISQLTNYTTPLDADLVPVVDTAATTTKKTTWANLKATLKTYFDTLYPAETTTTLGVLINGATGKTTPVDADMLALMDSAASNVVKKLSWANVKATLKTYFDTLYVTGTPVKTVKSQIFGAGSGTYTPSTGMLYCIVEIVGGGASGGSSAAGTGSSGGGSAGSYVKKLFTASDIGASKPYVVGTGGTAPAAGNNNGNNGNNSTFNSTTLIATGGAFGTASAAGQTAPGGGSGGGATSAPSGGDLNIAGGNGDAGINLAANNGGLIGGRGGDSFFAKGGSNYAGGGNNGNAGAGYGAGGSGCSSTGSNRQGGAGFDGVMIVTEFCSQ